MGDKVGLVQTRPGVWAMYVNGKLTHTGRTLRFCLRRLFGFTRNKRSTRRRRRRA